jgi:hypothetical protein
LTESYKESLVDFVRTTEHFKRYRNLSAETERSRIRIRSLAEQAQALRDGLTGLTEQDRNTLDEKKACDDIRASQTAWLQQVDAAGSEITGDRRLWWPPGISGGCIA